MKAVISTDEDARALLLQMKVSEQDVKTRFVLEAQVVTECYRRVHFDLVSWLQAQGFQIP